MRKFISKFTSIGLVLVIFVLNLFSCGNVGNQTGGFYDSIHFHKYWWLETYAECVDGINTLESYGSSFNETILVSYEGDLFDMKYCIFTNELKADKRSGLFVKRFERKVEEVVIMCFAFFEDVRLYDLKRSYVQDYKAYKIKVGMEYAKKFDFNYEGLTADSLECVEYTIHRQAIFEYRLKESNELVLTVECFKFRKEKLSDEIIQTIINSIDIGLYEQMKDSMIEDCSDIQDYLHTL